ncbi:MAG TPA: hypothetical protein VGS19_17420 [Streptosporangiaceae bacterium]|nr:hypothetical protein [Streptosporangiaceae bacterium]
MIIQLQGAGAEDVKAAWRELHNLADRWGQATAPAPVTTAFGTTQPVAAVAVSIPSAALTVRNPADRIRKRRRAKELIDEAQYLTAGQVTAWLISASRVVELRTLTPDQLLGLVGEDPVG